MKILWLRSKKLGFNYLPRSKKLELIGVKYLQFVRWQPQSCCAGPYRWIYSELEQDAEKPVRSQCCAFGGRKCRNGNRSCKRSFTLNRGSARTESSICSWHGSYNGTKNPAGWFGCDIDLLVAYLRSFCRRWSCGLFGTGRQLGGFIGSGQCRNEHSVELLASGTAHARPMCHFCISWLAALCWIQACWWAGTATRVVGGGYYSIPGGD